MHATYSLAFRVSSATLVLSETFRQLYSCTPGDIPTVVSLEDVFERNGQLGEALIGVQQPVRLTLRDSYVEGSSPTLCGGYHLVTLWWRVCLPSPHSSRVSDYRISIPPSYDSCLLPTDSFPPNGLKTCGWFFEVYWFFSFFYFCINLVSSPYYISAWWGYPELHDWCAP